MPPSLRTLFVGPNGVRAGWRVLLFVVTLAVVAVALLLAIRGGRAALGMPAPSAVVLNPGRVALSEGALLLAVVLASALFARVEKRTLADYGLSAGRTAALRWLEGLGWGVALMTSVLVVLKLTGNFEFGPRALPTEQAIAFAIGWAFVFLIVGVAETLVFSGYPLFALARGLGFWPAAELLAILFGAAHFVSNAGENWPGSVSLIVVGLLVAFTLRRTGSLWFAIGIHAAWDWAESFLYGVPDSGITITGHLLTPSFHGSPWMTGGTAGPEASVVTLAGYLVGFVLIGLRFRGRPTNTPLHRSGAVPI